MRSSVAFKSLTTVPLLAASCCHAFRESENNCKFLQLVSGASPAVYWLANFCWDMLNFLIPAGGIVLLVWWYDQPQLAGPRLVAMTVLLLAFGPAGITGTYLLHFPFKVLLGGMLTAEQLLSCV